VNWFRTNRRSAWIVGVTLLLPLLFFLNAVVGILSVRHEYQSSIDNLEPRIARLRGLIEKEDQLQQVAVEVDRRIPGLVYTASQDRATVSANLQQEVRQLLVDAGLSVTNSQVLPVREQELFDYIAVKVTVSGTLANLDAALSSLGSYMPLVLVESLDIFPRRSSRRNKAATEQAVTATLQLLSLRYSS